MNFRTDLAIETKEMYHESKGEGVEISGVEVEVEKDQEVSVTRIAITDENGEKVLGKPKGNYITLEVQGIINGDEVQIEETKKKAAKILAKELKKMISFHFKLKVLVVGLGNHRITPDSLGPDTVSKVRVTRQLFLVYEADGDYEMSCVSGFIPGVMASTGIETAEHIKRMVQLVEPEVVIAIDSLAARKAERISTTIQINDTGIAPGTGTGNMRKELNQDSLGVKVIAIGVPTVIDSKTLILEGVSDFLKDEKEAEQHLEKQNLDMIVTTTDIDQVVKDFSDIIANGINITLHPGIYS